MNRMANRKQGVDDFLAAHDPQALFDLIKRAVPVPVENHGSLSKPSARTDTANAWRLATKFGDLVRWVGPWDKWLCWDGQRWRIDHSLQIEAYAKDIAADLWKDVAEEQRQGNADKENIYFARISNSANGIRNMVAMAKSEPDIAIDAMDLDVDPWLLNVENGTIDLRTGILREHRKSDFITKIAPVEFDPAANCNQWIDFLTMIFDGHAELIAYVQKLVGYNLTGVIEEHILPFLFGTGSNGKSTFAEILLKLMGPDYAMKAPPDLLMAKRNESHPTERADLFGKRFVACIETEDGRRLAEALVKELTGGDRVRARRMREDFWEFTPTHHVWLAGNHKPAVNGTDHGIWRRIKLIPFAVTIPDDKQDKKLPAKLVAELPGILNWALAGCLAWQEKGMQEPSIVREATQEYSNEMDEVGLFIEECCELGPDFIQPATPLFEYYERQGGKMTQQSFGAALGRHGFQKCRITSGEYKARHGWKGLKIRGFSTQFQRNK